MRWGSALDRVAPIRSLCVNQVSNTSNIIGAQTVALRQDSLAFRRKPLASHPTTDPSTSLSIPLRNVDLLCSISSGISTPVNEVPRHAHIWTAQSTSTTQQSTTLEQHLNSLSHTHTHTHTPSYKQLIELLRTLPQQQRFSMLKPLLLPQLVEERRKRETLLDEELNISQASDIQESSASDCPPSPVLTTFSRHSHVKYGSSASSVDASMHSPLTDIPSSPTFTAMRASKRSLPDVQEDPLEREEDFDMIDEDPHGVYDWSGDDNTYMHYESAMGQSSVQLSTQPDFEYDLADGFSSDTDLGLSITKKRRAGDSPFSAIANRFGTRFPGLTRKWRTGKGSNPLSPSDVDGEVRRSRTSRGASSRSSSLSNSVYHGLALTYGDSQMPPTPAMSDFDRYDEPCRDSEEFERDEKFDGERSMGFVSTPLLPPMMMGNSATDADVPLQSPLDSPSVADPSEFTAGISTPAAGIATPPVRGMPSPPLSSKPSMSSIRRTHTIAPVHLTSSSEVLPIVIADIDDKWSTTLGHANFTIHPLPYLPERYDLEACRQLKKDWDLARCNYTKHLVRTGEHYGATSKTYELTEKKWKETDDVWRANNDATITRTAASGADAFASLKHNNLSDAEPNAMTKIPSLNDPRSEGKFPQLGDEDIVGPMTQATAQLQRNRSKKAKLMRFFAEKFPAGFGRGSA